jgi:hypothetical protein
MAIIEGVEFNYVYVGQYYYGGNMVRSITTPTPEHPYWTIEFKNDEIVIATERVIFKYLGKGGNDNG